MKHEYQEIPLNKIVKKSNYRQHFNDKTLRELAASIAEHGVVQPIIVRPNKLGKFDIIAGERRFLAARIAKLAAIPAIVRNLADDKFLETQLVENLQREGVPFMDEAFGVKKLRDDHDLDVTEICKKLGKSDWWVYTMLKLTEMSETAIVAAQRGEITRSVAIQISKLPTQDMQAKATVDLRRERRDLLISDRRARDYIQQAFADGKLPRRQNRIRGLRINDIAKNNGNDYAANWKKTLLSFSSEQFEQFKAIVKGRTETSAFAKAVEQVMLVEIGGGGSIWQRLRLSFV